MERCECIMWLCRKQSLCRWVWDVVLLGPLPTPGVAYLTRAQRASLGVVISASHNPYPDNGIKFFSAQGAKLPDAWVT